MIIRRARYAGSWYPGTKQALLKAIEGCFLSAFGPGEIPKRERAAGKIGDVIGIISPHAGLSYSGGVAANGYHAIALDGLPDTIVLIGSHGGFSGIYLQSGGKWESPLGETLVDDDLARRIVDHSTEIKEDNKYILSVTDNTFEMQLPFIQYLSLDIRLVPIAVGSRKPSKLMRAADELSNALNDYFKDGANEGKKVVIVASTDLTHYGPHFMFMPARGKPASEQNEWVRANDKKVIDMILNLENEEVPDILEHSLNKQNICCPGAIALALETIKKIKTKSNINKLEIQLLKQATSYDIESRTFGTFSAVGYASIVIKKSK
ncbi:MAG: AmmeMemoRadiSam system protein B [Promethearchaeota archaeon]